ncbi:HET-domain-containing protein, partial [Canariomyces notabilis]
MHWHDPTCPRLDGVCANNLISCIRCGSSKLLVSEDSKSLPGVLGPGSIYSPISQHTEIRLLVVHPGEFPEPVRCDMVTRAVGKAMYDYEAISYTWADETGDKTQSGLIFVNSTPIPVTRNCEMALRRVRWRSYERRIWIDAVCIDQTNIDERGHQVRLVPEIYARAKRVLIYIGEAADQSSSALQFIANGGFGNTPTQADLEVAKKALDRLLSRRYFSRIWVLQEIALARESKLICGDTTITWQLL